MLRAMLIFAVVMAAPQLMPGQSGVSFEATSDARQAVLDSYFDITFTLKNADGDNFTPPSFKDFIVVSGPNRSVKTSIINGQVSKEEGFIYTLKPQRLGRLVIGSATIRVKGRTLRSNPITIEVVQSRPGASEEAFIRAEASTTEARVGQQVILDYKLYTTVDVGSLNILSESDYQGFFARDIRRYDGRIIREVVKGKQYATKLLKRVALFPQQAGQLAIAPMEVQLGIIKEDGRRRNLFYTPEVRTVAVRTEPLSIEVTPLPAPIPASFSGAVGNFSMESALSRATVTTDDALTLILTINGSGDIKRVQAPELKMPDSFELYEPKVREEASYESTGGITGKKSFEYLMLPKEPGVFQLRPAFTYFDPDSARYITIDETVYDITVRPGTGRGQARIQGEEGDLEESGDIHFLMTSPGLQLRRPPFLGSALFWLLALLPGLALGAIVFFRRWRVRQANIDPTMLRSRHARKVAQQRLATARQHLNAGHTRAFYDEVSKAMLGYACDKLHIPRSSLSKASLQRQLEQLKLDKEAITRFLSVIQTCEMALFAGKDDAAAMQDTYQNAIQVVADMEGQLSGNP